MSSQIDTPLDNFVKSNRGKNKTRGRGRGIGGFQKIGYRYASKQKGIGRGIKRGGAQGVGNSRSATSIISRLGFTTKLKAAQNGVNVKNIQKVSDLRDVLVTKNKSVTDLRAKLPPKAPTKPEKKKPLTQPRDKDKLRDRSPLRISSDMFRSSQPKGGGSSRSKDAIFSKSNKEGERTLSRRLPTTAEAKKITVTVQGLSKTTSEAYRKEERLAAVIARQKETRQQNYMRSREEFIASSITSAISGDGRGGDMSRGGMSYHTRYRSPSPPPMLEYQHYEAPPLPPPPPMPMVPQPRHRGQGGITSVTTLVISNLNDTVSHSDVHELCTAIGPVESVTMTAPGVTEVTFRYKDDALEAYKKYNQRNLDGMPMMCRLQPGHSRTPTARPLPAPTHQMNTYASRVPDPFLPDNLYGNYY